MIDYKNNKLKNVLKYERSLYYDTYLSYLIHKIMHAETAIIYKFQKYLRKAEFYKFKNKKIRFAIYLRKKNKLGNKLGFSIHCGTFDMGLKIHHIGTVVVNGDARVGKNCTLHGNNCIGNTNDDNSLVPMIGDNFKLGFDSMVYGKVKICDNVTIGAKSLVNKDISNEGIYVGIPIKLV